VVALCALLMCVRTCECRGFTGAVVTERGKSSQAACNANDRPTAPMKQERLGNVNRSVRATSPA
jgi:hypothetical protein